VHRLFPGTMFEYMAVAKAGAAWTRRTASMASPGNGFTSEARQMLVSSTVKVHYITRLVDQISVARGGPKPAPWKVELMTSNVLT
jgi:hypothetical protein